MRTLQDVARKKYENKIGLFRFFIEEFRKGGKEHEFVGVET